MRYLSYWGLRNPKKAILLIALLQIILVLSSSILGVLLFSEGVLLPFFLIPTGVVAYVAFALAYPNFDKSDLSYAFSFRRRKLFDFGIMGCVALLFAVNSNNHATLLLQPEQESISYAKTVVFGGNESKYNQRKSKKTDKKAKRQAIKEQIKTFLQAPENQTKRRGLIALTIIVALIAAGGIAISACAIGCATAAVVGAIFGALGGIAIIVGAVFIIRAINRKYKTTAAIEGG